MDLWLDEQLVVTLDGPEGRREIVIPRPFARVGGHPDSEIPLAGPGVAKRAQYLHATREGLFCLDLDVEDGAAEKRGRWLAPDDVIRIGSYAFSARVASNPLPSLEPPALLFAAGSAPAPYPILNVHCQKILKDKRRFRARLNLVGRRPQCALQLRGNRVSSFHCALFWDQRRLWCVDLLSSNGMQLNGERIDCGEVLLNDRLEVGEFGLVYYRWSPRRSMQPGWRPVSETQALDHESEPAEAPPALYAAPPPSTADAELTLADTLDETGASDEALEHGDLPAAHVPPRVKPPSLGAPNRPLLDPAIDSLRSELELERSQRSDDRQRMLAEQAESMQRLAAQAAEMQAAQARWEEERQTAAADRVAWKAERESLSKQLAERSQQIDRLTADLKAVKEARDQQQTACANFQQELTELRDRLAKLQQTMGQHQAQLADREAELARRAAEITRLQSQTETLAAAKAQAEALAAAPREPIVSPEQLRIQQQLEAQVQALTEQHRTVQAQWAESSQRFTAQVEQLNAEADQLRDEQKRATAAQDEWQAQRLQLREEASESSRRLAAMRTELFAASAALAQRQADLARATQERQDLQSQWTAATQQLSAQAERGRDDSARYSRQRSEFDAEQQRWQVEQRRLRDQLDELRQQLAERDAELAQRASEVEMPSRENAALIALAPLSLSSLESAPAESAAEPTSGHDDAEVVDFFSAEPAIEETAAPAAASPAEQIEPTAAVGSLPIITRTELPSGRRNKAQRQEMTTFIGDRLSALEQGHRRRRLLLWASVAAGTLVLSAVAFGVWYMLQ